MSEAEPQPAAARAERPLDPAIALLHRGRFAEAEAALRPLLDAEPENVDALQLIAVVRHKQGHSDEAIALLERALALAPARPAIRVNLANILRERGRLAEAIAAYRTVTEAAPQFAEGHINLSLALAETDATAEALEACERALAIKPDFGEALTHRAVMLSRLGRRDEGDAAFIAAMAQRPGHLRTRHGYAIHLGNTGRWEEACPEFEQVVAGAPRWTEAVINLSRAQRSAYRYPEAVATAKRALELEPGSVDALVALAQAERARGDLEAAMAALREAVARAPDHARAWAQLGETLRESGAIDAALEAGRRGAALRPEQPDVQLSLATTLMLIGDLGPGFDAYEWRWHVPNLPVHERDLPQPFWTGEPLGDGTLLLFAEQGVGDEIMFGGLIPELLATGPRCVFECGHRLKTLLERSLPGLEIIERANPPVPRALAPDIVARLATTSLPRLLRRDYHAFPPIRPYLVPDAERVAMLRARHRGLGPGPVVGVSWRSKNGRFGQHKTTALETLLPILRVPGAVFVDLQYGDTTEERAALEAQHGIVLHNDPDIDSMADLDACAAQVAAVDLVVSLSNTTVHVGAALGKPVWTLLPTGPGLIWYWFLEREDSPWYPTMRLFRQPRQGDWDTVVARVAAALPDWIAGYARRD